MFGHLVHHNSTARVQQLFDIHLQDERRCLPSPVRTCYSGAPQNGLMGKRGSPRPQEPRVASFIPLPSYLPVSTMTMFLKMISSTRCHSPHWQFSLVSIKARWCSSCNFCFLIPPPADLIFSGEGSPSHTRLQLEALDSVVWTHCAPHTHTHTSTGSRHTSGPQLSSALAGSFSGSTEL